MKGNGQKIPINVIPELRLNLCVSDRAKPKVVFLNLKAYVKSDIGNVYQTIYKLFKQLIRQHLTNGIFHSKYILDINLEEEDIENKFKFMETEIYLRQNEDLPLKTLFPLAYDKIKRFAYELKLSMEEMEINVKETK